MSPYSTYLSLLVQKKKWKRKEKKKKNSWNPVPFPLNQVQYNVWALKGLPRQVRLQTSLDFTIILIPSFLPFSFFFFSHSWCESCDVLEVWCFRIIRLCWFRNFYPQFISIQCSCWIGSWHYKYEVSCRETISIDSLNQCILLFIINFFGKYSLIVCYFLFFLLCYSITNTPVI